MALIADIDQGSGSSSRPAWLRPIPPERREVQILHPSTVAQGSEARYIPCYTFRVPGAMTRANLLTMWPKYSAKDGQRCMGCGEDLLGHPLALIRRKHKDGSYEADGQFCARGGVSCALSWVLPHVGMGEFDQLRQWTLEFAHKHFGIRGPITLYDQRMCPRFNNNAFKPAQVYGTGDPQAPELRCTLEAAPCVPYDAVISVRRFETSRYAAPDGKVDDTTESGGRTRAGDLGERESLDEATRRGVVRVEDASEGAGIMAPLPGEDAAVAEYTGHERYMSQEERENLSRVTDLRRPRVRAFPIQERQPEGPPRYVSFLGHVRRDKDQGLSVFSDLPSAEEKAKKRSGSGTSAYAKRTKPSASLALAASGGSTANQPPRPAAKEAAKAAKAGTTAAAKAVKKGPARRKSRKERRRSEPDVDMSE